MTLHVFRSNRSEILAEALASAVARPADPMVAERVIVGSRGMERWLQQELARRNGVAAHVQFPFPGAFVHEVLDALLRDAELAARWRPEVLALAIGTELTTFGQDPAMGALAQYLAADDGSGVRRVQLAHELARLYDRYAVYRPEVVLGWDAGASDDPQAVLWRRMVARLGPHHLAARLERLRSTPLTALRAALPPRIHAFQPTGLPPQLLAAFSRFSEVVPVSLYVLSPADGWWADTRSWRQRLAEAERRGIPLDEALGDGPVLLAELGASGRDFQTILEDHPYVDLPLYEDPGRATLLRRLQREMWENAAPSAKEPLDPNDQSVEIHLASSPVRELEVLRDRLLTAFEADPTLLPEDVLVAVPELERYAGAITAVFGAPSTDGPRVGAIPFRVADRSRRAEGEVLDALERVLGMFDGRLGAAEVIELLGLPVVRDRLGLGTDDVDRLATWIDQANVRWGLDASHRAAEGVPARVENTWVFGLRRMLLGYAAPGTLFAGVAPLGGVEGSAATAIGALCDLVEALGSLREEAKVARPLAGWCAHVAAVVDRVCDGSGDRANELRAVHETLTRLARQADAAGATDPLSFEAALVPIRGRLEESGSPRGFLTGGVTFCSLEPLRAIPFRVVAVLGLEAEAFPRGGAQRALDLMRGSRRPGDREPREDDRYLFLETVLAARDHLWLSHVGRDPREPRVRPASAVVHALVEAVAAGHVPTAADGAAVDLEAVWAALVRRHPLQPFEPNHGHPTWSPAWSAAARSRGVSPAPPAPFAHGQLGYLAPEHDLVLLDQLRAFVRSPARWYLRDVLGLHLPGEEQEIEAREPLILDPLALAAAVQPLIDRAVRDDVDPDALWELVAASGALPAGRAGRMLFDGFRPTLDAIVSGVRDARGDHQAAHCTVDTRVTVRRTLRVVGRIEGIYGDRVVTHTVHRIHGARQLEAWLHHVCAGAVGRPVETRVIGRSPTSGKPTALVFRPVEDAAVHLRNLTAMLARAWDQPVPLFPDASLAYVETEGDHRKRMTAARDAWDGVERSFPRRPPDRWVELLWRGHDVLGDTWVNPWPGGQEFVKVAQFAFEGLVEARRWSDLD